MSEQPFPCTLQNRATGNHREPWNDWDKLLLNWTVSFSNTFCSPFMVPDALFHTCFISELVPDSSWWGILRNKVILAFLITSVFLEASPVVGLVQQKLTVLTYSFQSAPSRLKSHLHSQSEIVRPHLPQAIWILVVLHHFCYPSSCNRRTMMGLTILVFQQLAEWPKGTLHPCIYKYMSDWM